VNRGNRLCFTFWFSSKLIIGDFLFCCYLMTFYNLIGYIASNDGGLMNDELECGKKLSWIVLFNNAISSIDV
jgi:hypothetical protein